MSLLNLPKLIVAVVAMLCITLLAMTDHVAPEAAVALIASVLSYILGNGVAAVQGKPVTPIIGPKVAPEPPPADPVVE